MNKIFLILPILLTLFSSCETNLELDLGENKSLLILNAFAGNDSLVKVHLSRSTAIQDRLPAENVTDAIVELYEEGTLMGRLQPKGNEWYEMDYRFKSDKDYQIKVNELNKNIIGSRTRIPYIVPISEIKLVRTESKRRYFKLKFHDRKLERDYYMILIKCVYEQSGDFGTFTSEQELAYYSTDLVFNGNLIENTNTLERNYLLGSRAFSDKSFNGQEAEISFYADPYDPWGTCSYLKFELYHISKDYYAYERSKTILTNREDLPIYKKINQYSNVDSGAGIFAGYALSTANLKVE